MKEEFDFDGPRNMNFFFEDDDMDNIPQEQTISKVDTETVEKNERLNEFKQFFKDSGLMEEIISQIIDRIQIKDRDKKEEK